MTERAPRKEIVDTGELFFLSHPGTDETFSSYGLVMQPGDQGLLVGLLMTDRPRPADLEWLDEVEPERLPHLCRVPGEKNTAIQTALQPLPANPPKPVFNLRCDEESRNWHSEFPAIAELSDEIRQALEQSGYGCVAAETNIGVVHVCHAADGGIEAFANKPVSYT